jgi:hypothetical protein
MQADLVLDLACCEIISIAKFVCSSEQKKWQKLSAQQKRQFIDQMDAVKVKACDPGNGQEYLSIAETGTSPFDLA